LSRRFATSQHAFEEFVENEARRNALATRLDLTADTVSQLLEDKLTKEEVLDAVVEHSLETDSKNQLSGQMVGNQLLHRTRLKQSLTPKIMTNINQIKTILGSSPQYEATQLDFGEHDSFVQRQADTPEHYCEFVPTKRTTVSRTGPEFSSQPTM